MAVSPTVFRIFNIGAETTPGTEVDADVRISGTQVTMRPQVQTTQYRPSGYRWETVSALNKDWAQMTLSGPVTYTEACYWLESGFKVATPSGSADYTRVYDMSTTAANTTQTYTIEGGDSNRAQLFTGGQVDSIGMRFTRDGVEWVNTTMFAQELQDGITLTSSPTAVALIPVLPTQVSVKMAAAQSGLTAASALTDWINAEWSVQNIMAPYWSLNADSSYSDRVAQVPNGSVTFLAPVNSAGMGELSNIRTGTTRFMRIQAVGATIGAGPATYAITCDLALKITGITELRDEGGVFAVQYSAKITHDTTWGKGISVTVVNELATL